MQFLYKSVLFEQNHVHKSGFIDWLIIDKNDIAIDTSQNMKLKVSFPDGKQDEPRLWTGHERTDEHGLANLNDGGTEFYQLGSVS